MVLPRFVLLISLLSVMNWSLTATAQESGIAVPIAQLIQNGGIQPAGEPPSGEPAKEPKPADGGNPDGDAKPKPDGENPDPPPKVIRRDDTTLGDADPSELDAAVGDDGRVSFQFRNQRWVDLTAWLSEIADRPIDWLELPADKVNLSSPGRYTVAEAMNLFNRHLLARGYTLLELDAGLTIVKTDGINPAIVPRMDVSALRSLPSYTFVRTTLDAGWLSAEKLVEEFKPLISAGGRLSALATTNKIEAMDAAINLREIARLLENERGSDSRLALAPEFRLRHLPVFQAKAMLEEFLGVEEKDEPAMTPEQMQQMQRGGQPPPPPPPKPDISIVANVRQNSILVRAAPDRVAVAIEFLKRIDVPSDVMTSLADIKSRVQVFRLGSLDPDKLIDIVHEMNILEPGTRIRTDKDNQAIIVSGSAADRYIITTLIERLDGSGRTFEVMPLRRLDTAEVAESIAFLMGQKKEEKEQDSRRSYYSYFSRGDDEEEKKNTDEFRVAANTRNRQILLWANEHEMRQVESLLVKLGELPPPGGSRQTVRVIDASATPETLEYLRRLKSQFSRLAPNELELPQIQFADQKTIDSLDLENDASRSDQQSGQPAAPSGGIPMPSDERKENDAVEARLEPATGDNPFAGNPVRSSMLTAMVQQEMQSPGDSVPNQAIRSAADFDRLFGSKPAAGADPDADSDAGAPVVISFDRDGNLILSSNDTAALDRLENMMLQTAPPQKPYRVFTIEHASASWMRTNLEEYFRDADEQDESDGDTFFRWYFGNESNTKKAKPSGLGKGVKLRFVDDIDTNTLVVSGATPSQLATISDLIGLWDVPEPVNKRRTRFTELVTIEFGKAETIAETVKEAYRDLLSSNDKTFNQDRGGDQGDSFEGRGRNGAVSKSRGGGGSNFESGEETGGGDDFSFKGKLSVGIDPIGNTILVSAEGDALLSLVVDMIGQLDRAAMPSTDIEVLEVADMMGDSRIGSVLKAMSSTSGGTPLRPETE